jgi:hypothetical protein
MPDEIWTQFNKADTMNEQERAWAMDLDGRYSGIPATLDELRIVRRNTSDPDELDYIDALINALEEE